MDIQSINSISLTIDDHKKIVIDADTEGFLKIDVLNDDVSILEIPCAISQLESRKFQALFNSLNSSRSAAVS